MHLDARQWVERFAAAGHQARILDVGGRNINGTVRDLFTPASYTTLDIRPGPGVDVQCDFLHYHGEAEPFDMILHLEVAEHTPDWRDHLTHASTLLRPDGYLIFTAAGPGRLPHSAEDGGALRPGEFYENIDSTELSGILSRSYSSAVVREARGVPAALRPGAQHGDVYATARR